MGVITMTVTFCGHRQMEHGAEVTAWLRNVVEDLIREGAVTFYLGGMGAFDRLAASVVRESKARHPHIQLVLVLAYLEAGRDCAGYDYSLYPSLESVPRRYAIVHRNRWMVEAAHVVVGYVLHSWGGAAATLSWARQKKKRIISFVERPAPSRDESPA